MMVLSLLIAWLLTDLVATYSVIHYRRGLKALAPARETPKVAILAAIKGVSETTRQFLERLSLQQYTDYRLVFSLESTADTALPLIEGFRQELAGRIEVGLVIAGQSTMRAQKVHNLLAALRTLRDDDRIVVFADADILPDAQWLLQLIRPIANREVAASTGYRWQLPVDGRWPTLIAASVDLSIATAARSWRWNLCWGGSVAIERGALDQIDLPTVWNRAASDDLTLTRALRTRGFKMNSPLHTLVPSPVAYNWTGLFSFARRQYLMVWTYAPKHWLLAGWTLCVPTVAAAIGAIETEVGRRWAAVFIFGSIALLQVRLCIRRQIAHLVLPRAEVAAARRTIAFARWAWPLIHVVHLGAFLTSCGARRFTWGGINYRLHRSAVVAVERGAGEA